MGLSYKDLAAGYITANTKFDPHYLTPATYADHSRYDMRVNGRDIKELQFHPGDNHGRSGYLRIEMRDRVVEAQVGWMMVHRNDGNGSRPIEPEVVVPDPDVERLEGLVDDLRLVVATLLQDLPSGHADRVAEMLGDDWDG
jgi:hypothetical protein